MQPFKTRYTLTDNIQAETLVLQYHPDGWDDAGVKWTRNEKYFGLFRSFSVPLRFVKDGAEFIRRAFYSYGVNADVEIKIERCDNNWDYVDFYTGKLDFTQIKDEKVFVEINAIDGGLSALIKANESKVYEIFFTESTEGFQRFTLDSGLDENLEGLRIYDLFREIIDKVTNGGITAGTYAIQSDLLTEMSDILENFFIVTCGKQLRTVQAPIKTTLEEFFKTVNAIKCIGMGVQIIDGKETVILEQREYFFDGTAELISFSSVTGLKVSPQQEWLFNQIKVGYESISIDVDNPIQSYEFADNITYSTLSDKIKNEYEAVAKYRADWTGILECSNLGSLTIDLFPDDYTNFIMQLHVDNSRYTILNGQVDRKPGSSPVTWNNVDISPRRCLAEHESFINSCLWGLEASGVFSVEYQSAGLDISQLLTAANGEINFLDEISDIDVSAGKAYFKPFIFEFEAPSDINIIDEMASNPYGYITFVWQNNEYSGFVMEIGAVPTQDKIKQYRLLCTAATDLTKMITTNYI